MSGKEMRKLIESIIIEDDASERLYEIKDEIKELMKEAKSILQHTDERTWARAKSYWYAHIVSALDKEHDYMGGSTVTMQDTIDEIAGPSNIEDAVEAVEYIMNEKSVSVEDAVEEVSNGTNLNYNELMAAVQRAMNLS